MDMISWPELELLVAKWHRSSSDDPAAYLSHEEALATDSSVYAADVVSHLKELYEDKFDGPQD